MKEERVLPGVDTLHETNPHLSKTSRQSVTDVETGMPGVYLIKLILTPSLTRLWYYRISRGGTYVIGSNSPEQRKRAYRKVRRISLAAVVSVNIKVPKDVAAAAAIRERRSVYYSPRVLRC